jgi:site-specific recombinase XerD
MPDKSTTLEELLPSFRRFLRAKNRSERTIASYDLAAAQLIDHLAGAGHSGIVTEITRGDIEGFLVHVLRNRASATAKQRYASLHQLFNWLLLEDEIPVNPFDRMTPPQVIEQPVPVISEDDLRALLATCNGPTFDDKRDAAILRFLIDTGVRLGELGALTMSDVDLDLERAVVFGKGRRLRFVPFGKKTTQALDRYERARRHHRHAHTEWFWLGLRGRLSDSGISQVVLRRGQAAGLGRIHPHQFRHSAAHRWLAAGGSEGDLQRLMGWQSPQMLTRYGRSAAEERAIDAHRRLALGDDL